MRILTKVMWDAWKQRVKSVSNITDDIMPELSLMTEAKILKLPLDVDKIVTQVRNQIQSQIEAREARP